MVEPVHDRMPVILTPDAEQIWLDRSVQDKDLLTVILIPYAPKDMYCHGVSNIIGKRGVDSPKCIDEVG